MKSGLCIIKPFLTEVIVFCIIYHSMQLLGTRHIAYAIIPLIITLNFPTFTTVTETCVYVNRLSTVLYVVVASCTFHAVFKEHAERAEKCAIET